MEKQVIKIIYGPTSSGKTSFAINACKKSGGVIISADSRQIYKYMDIGTGKVPISIKDLFVKKGAYYEIDSIKVYGYDLVAPDEDFSGYEFAKYALEISNELLKQNTPVYLVGGTGFYIDLFTGNVKPSNVLPNEKLRKELSQKSLETLQNVLRELSPFEFEMIDKNNPVRLIRAIEKLENEKNTESLTYLENVTFEYIPMNVSREENYARADLWCESIWVDSFFDEVKYLMSKYGSSEKLKGLIYKSAVSYLKNEMSFAESLQRAKFDIHAYIRRQSTYFKKMLK